MAVALALLSPVVGSWQAVAATCDGKLTTCAIGDTGPGGGAVFYDAGSAKKWGRYLEVAPAGWSGSRVDPTAQWCPGSKGYTVPGTKTDIGAGPANTRKLLAACSKDGAAARAAAYRGGGKPDWFLPSRDEAIALLMHRSVLAGLDGSLFWTSSQADDFDPDYAAFIRLGDGFEGGIGSKGLSFGVRPIRAF